MGFKYTTSIFTGKVILKTTSRCTKFQYCLERLVQQVTGQLTALTKIYLLLNGSLNIQFVVSLSPAYWAPPEVLCVLLQNQTS